ncbi:hypothetical protein NQV05_03455 [Mycoplasmopsis agalactiae]|uniref:Mbov_0729 family lipopotein n=1 Tax=Mycoplasmopsis agalactiae TaxID=2110 RepID=UPI00211C941E|nr:hypothetical protein [Mycoplasmopsis agalactiae]UUM25429.1 hypothetical protein NQV05_03455 [Mycoplasmopsis agalactiae]
MKKRSNKTYIIGPLVTLGSFPIIAAKCAEGNNSYDSKNDSPQVINPIKDGSKDQNDENNTSNNDQSIDNSNKSDKTITDSEPKKETDQQSTNNSADTPSSSLTPPASKTKPKESHNEAASRLTKEYFDLLFNNTNRNHSDTANNSMLKPMNSGNTVPNNQNIKKKEMHDEAASRLTKEYFDLLFSIQSNKDKIYNLSQNGIIEFLYKAFAKYGQSIKDKLNSRESLSNINNELQDSYEKANYSWSKNEDYFTKFGLDRAFRGDFFDFFDLLSELFTDYKDGENDNKNKADELFKKTKSKLEEAYKKISKHQ